MEWVTKNAQVLFCTRFRNDNFGHTFRRSFVQKFVFCVLGLATCYHALFQKWPFESNGEKVLLSKNMFGRKMQNLI